MPTTPGLTITDQVIWDRVFAAFNGSQQEYLVWLRTAMREEVTRRELEDIDCQRDIARAQKITELRNALEPNTPPPAVP